MIRFATRLVMWRHLQFGSWNTLEGWDQPVPNEDREMLKENAAKGVRSCILPRNEPHPFQDGKDPASAVRPD